MFFFFKIKKILFYTKKKFFFFLALITFFSPFLPSFFQNTHHKFAPPTCFIASTFFFFFLPHHFLLVTVAFFFFFALSFCLGPFFQKIREKKSVAARVCWKICSRIKPQKQPNEARRRSSSSSQEKLKTRRGARLVWFGWCCLRTLSFLRSFLSIAYACVHAIRDIYLYCKKKKKFIVARLSSRSVFSLRTTTPTWCSVYILEFNLCDRVWDSWLSLLIKRYI